MHSSFCVSLFYVALATSKVQRAWSTLALAHMFFVHTVLFHTKSKRRKLRN